jgi:hypothetical protein
MQKRQSSLRLSVGDVEFSSVVGIFGLEIALRHPKTMPLSCYYSLLETPTGSKQQKYYFKGGRSEVITKGL